MKKHLLSFALLAILLVGCSSVDTDTNSSSSSSSSYSPTTTETQWYEGGTLHSSTVAVWKSARYDNKLATSGDYIAAATGAISKSKASNLMDCIDEAAQDLSAGSSQQVSEFASVCIIMLGY